MIMTQQDFSSAECSRARDTLVLNSNLQDFEIHNYWCAEESNASPDSDRIPASNTNSVIPGFKATAQAINAFRHPPSHMPSHKARCPLPSVALQIKGNDGLDFIMSVSGIENCQASDQTCCQGNIIASSNEYSDLS